MDMDYLPAKKARENGQEVSYFYKNVTVGPNLYKLLV